MEEHKQQELDLNDWNDFQGSYLKAAMVKQFPCKVAVTGIRGYIDENNKPRLVLDIEYEEKAYKFEANATNRKAIRKAVPNPKDIVGRILTFDKIKVNNPSTNEIVDSLFIDNVE